MSTTYAQTIDNMKIYAERAVQDKDGNQLDTTYATKTEVSTGLAGKQDTISDLQAIREGAADGATAVQPGDLATVATTGAYSDLSGTPDLSVYAQTADLATVATTGAYSDLTGTPTIPTATSDLTNDSGFITAADIPAQVQADWTETDTSDPAYIAHKPTLATVATSGDYDDLTNKPTIPAAQVNSDWDAVSGVAQILNKPTLATVATTGDYSDLSNTPAIPTATSDLTNDSGFITASDIPAQVQADWTESDTTDPAYIQHKPSLATVATSGDYDDLTNKPTIPAAQVNSDWNSSSGVSQILNKPTLATVATSGDYDDLTNKPTIPAAQVNSDWDAVSGVAQILNKPSLATVATTGAYSDLSGTPTIPTATSDLTNDSGFITASDIPAQVQADWTESDTTDPSYIQNKPSLATVATSGSYSDLSNTPDLSIYAETSDLATVATTGAYSDLTGTPTIPTATSDLTNDSGFITASDIPAQVQADWTEADTSDPSYIANKPTLATVATSGDYDDLLNKPVIPDGVPTVTSWDNNKVLKASYSGGTGSYSWQAESGGSNYTAGDAIEIISDEISVDYDADTLALVSNYGSDETLSTVDNYYPYGFQTNSTVSGWITSAVSGDTLRIKIPGGTFYVSGSTYPCYVAILQSPSDQYGAHAWYTGVTLQANVQGNSSYILEQTVEIPLPMGGTGWGGGVFTASTYAISVVSPDPYGNIQYASNDSALSPSILVAKKSAGGSLAVKNPLPASTSGDASKVLTVDNNGDPAWSAAQAPISAGNGISISSNTVSAKVDGTTVSFNASGELQAAAAVTVDQTYDATSTNAQSGTAVAGALADYTPTASLATVATTGDYDDLLNKPSIPAAQVNSDWDAASGIAQILNKPTLATVATSGSYNDLSNTPTLATVATSGSYNDLSNTPTIPTVDQTYDSASTNAQSGVAVASGISTAIGDLPTNLSAAQITALKAALGLDETVLWSGASAMSGNPSLNLSESAMNFRFIDIYSLPHSTNDIPIVTRICMEGLSQDTDAQGSFTITGHAGGGGFRINNAYLRITNYTSMSFTEQKQSSIIGTTVSTASAANSIVKIVGVNRIAST